jgi:hypothetical protein
MSSNVLYNDINNDNQYNEPESIILNLENLTVQYNNLLTQYNQAVVNYTTFLQQESITPCGKYTSDSTNIDQTCYNYIWQKSGCTQPAQQLSSIPNSSSVTLDQWILNSFNMATNTDDNSRMTCYGHVDNPYMIIAVGTDGNLWCRPDGLTGSGQKVNDNSNGTIRSICTGSDGKTILGINVNNQIWSKSSWDATSWQGPYIAYNCVETTTPGTSTAPYDNTYTEIAQGMDTPYNDIPGAAYGNATVESCQTSCNNIPDCAGIVTNAAGNLCWPKTSSMYPYSSDLTTNPDRNIYVRNKKEVEEKVEVKFLSIAQAPDGTFVAVGTDHTLWTAPNLQSCWTNVATNTNGNESENAVCIGPNGRVIVANGIDLWYKDSYQNLQNQVWQYGGPGCCLDITVAPDGTLMDAGACNDYQIWTIDSYMNLDGGWKGPYPGTCCIISLTTVINTNYSATGYSTATQPNYNIDSQPLTAVQGQAFWGTGPIGSQNPYTDITSVSDCQALCSSTANCTGATFNPSVNGQPRCWLRTGDGEPMPGLPNDYAIVPTAVELLSIVDQINTQLLEVNALILSNITRGEPIYDSEAYSRKNKTEELILNYETLQKEREKIKEEIRRYESLDAAQLEGNITINTNYYSFLLLMVLAVIVFFVLFKLTFIVPTQTSIFSSPQSGGGLLDKTTYYLIFAIIVFILLVIYYKNIIKTTTSTINNSVTVSTAIIRNLSGGLTDGKVFNFN